MSHIAAKCHILHVTYKEGPAVKSLLAEPGKADESLCRWGRDPVMFMNIWGPCNELNPQEIFLNGQCPDSVDVGNCCILYT